MSATSGQVVALHFGGRYLDANFGVPTGELAIDGRVVDTGVSFAGAPAPRQDAYATAWTSEAAAGAAVTDGGAAGSLTFTVPLTISIAVAKPG